jgi:hypothetical protein
MIAMKLHTFTPVTLLNALGIIRHKKGPLCAMLSLNR